MAHSPSLLVMSLVPKIWGVSTYKPATQLYSSCLVTKTCWPLSSTEVVGETLVITCSWRNSGWHWKNWVHLPMYCGVCNGKKSDQNMKNSNLLELPFDSRNVTISLNKVKNAFIFTSTTIIPAVIATGTQCSWKQSGRNSIHDLWPKFLWLPNTMFCLLTTMCWEKQEENRKMFVSVTMVSLPRMMKNKGDGIDTSWLRWWLYCLELNRGGNKSVLSLTGMTRGVCKAHVSSTQFSVLTISHLPSSSTSEVVCECKEKWHSPLKDKLTKLICFTCSQTPDSSTAS